MVLCSMFGRYSTFADGKLNAKKLNLKHKTMNKFKKTVLMLCLILSGAFCYAHSEVGMNQKEDGTSILYTFGRYYVASAVVICENHENEYPGFHKHVTSVQYGRLGYVNNDVIGFENL